MVIIITMASGSIYGMLRVGLGRPVDDQRCIFQYPSNIVGVEETSSRTISNTFQYVWIPISGWFHHVKAELLDG